ncbi:MAG: YgiT-type zinc finger protein [Spirochaetales bacterium]|nr:YgiT-type zinc finger protein [Spirochaetales bacterium]
MSDIFIPIVVIKDVPGRICNNCGEYLLTEEVTDYLMKILDDAIAHGASLEMVNCAA